MSGFGDSRHVRRLKHKIVVKCGSCGRRPGPITLPVTRLRRCQACWDDMRGFCELVRDSEEPTQRASAQPELEGLRVAPKTQPFASVPNLAKKAKDDFKSRQAGEDVA